MTDLLGPFATSAHAYVRNGWSPLPLPVGRKTPPPTGYTGRRARVATGADVQAWIDAGRGLGNIAVAIPSGVVGIDVDTYGEKKGAETMRALTAELGKLPRTVVSSRRWETHPGSGIRFFQVPPGTELVGNLEDLGGGTRDVEVIQPHHRYAVIAPSIVEGEVYRLRDQRVTDLGLGLGSQVLPLASELPFLPDAWIDRLRAQAPAEVTAPDASAIQLTDGQPSRDVLNLQGEVLTELRRKGGSRHDTVLRLVMRLTRLAEQGETGTRGVALSCRQAFIDAVSGPHSDRSRTPADAAAEFDRMLPGALLKVAQSPTPDLSFDPTAPPIPTKETPSWEPSPTPSSSPSRTASTTPSPTWQPPTSSPVATAAPAPSVSPLSTSAWSAATSAPSTASSPPAPPSAPNEVSWTPPSGLPSPPSSVSSDGSTPSWQTPTSLDAPAATPASVTSASATALPPGTGEPLASWAPVDLAALLEDAVEMPKAEVWEIVPGQFLLYRGAVHSLQGQPETWKSWLSLVAAASCLRAGQSVLLIDSEERAQVAIARLLQLGVTKQEIRLGLTIVNPDSDFRTVGEWEAFLALCSAPRDLVVIDSVAAVSGLSGVKENSNDEVTQWFTDVPLRLAKSTLAAVLVTDHVPKPSQQAAAGAERYAIGAQAKLARVQVAYRVSVGTDAPARGRRGRVSLTPTKDRFGDLKERFDVAHVTVDSRGDGIVIAAHLDMKPTGEAAVQERQREHEHELATTKTEVSAAILRALQRHAEGLNRTDLRAAVKAELALHRERGVKHEVMEAFRDQLADDGIVQVVREGKAFITKPAADWVEKSRAAGIEYTKTSGVPDLADVAFDPTAMDALVADHDEETAPESEIP